jgi:DNA polymerase III subunit epsilon
MPHKRFYYDLETTGLDSKKNGFFQVAALIEIDNKIEERHVWFCKPLGQPDPATIQWHKEKGMLTDAGFDDPKFIDTKEFYNQFIEVLTKFVNRFKKTDKFHGVGYNCHSFDVDFLRELFTFFGNKYFGAWFWHPNIDVMLLAAELLQRERHQLVNFKNTTVAKYLGIEVDESKAHEALYDIELTRKIYIEIKKRIAGKV